LRSGYGPGCTSERIWYVKWSP